MNKQVLKKLNKEQLDQIIKDPEEHLMTDDELKKLKVIYVEEQDKIQSDCIDNKSLQKILKTKQEELLDAQTKVSDLYLQYQQEWMFYLEILQEHQLEPIRGKLKKLELEAEENNEIVGKQPFSDTFVQEYRISRDEYYRRHLKFENSGK